VETKFKRFENVPPRIDKLPISEKGFPIPWFAATMPDGTRDFRVVDPVQMAHAVRHKKCWVCGEQMGKHMSFVIGPMCGVNRTISDPPSHLECATFSALNCPFLSRPLAKRNTEGLDGMREAGGFGLKRNPGVVGVWTTQSYKPFRAHAGASGILFEIGPPDGLSWYANGRVATDEEVYTSVATGLPHLIELAKDEGNEAVRYLKQKLLEFEKLSGLFFPGLVPTV
jgi:hypothetical protein